MDTTTHCRLRQLAGAKKRFYAAMDAVNDGREVRRTAKCAYRRKSRRLGCMTRAAAFRAAWNALVWAFKLMTVSA